RSWCRRQIACGGSLSRSSQRHTDSTHRPTPFDPRLAVRNRARLGRDPELLRAHRHSSYGRNLSTRAGLRRLRSNAEWQGQVPGRTHNVTLRRPQLPMDRLRSRFFILSRFIHHYLLWFLISVYVIAAFYPTAGLWIRNASLGSFSILQERMPISLLMLMLSLLMFNAGLGVKAAHLRRIFQKKLMVFIGLAANVVVPVAYIFVVTLIMRFWYEPVEAQYILIGVALVAAMPIAGASTAWAQN